MYWVVIYCEGCNIPSADIHGAFFDAFFPICISQCVQKKHLEKTEAASDAENYEIGDGKLYRNVTSHENSPGISPSPCF